MLHLVKSTKSNRSFQAVSSSDSCHDDKTITCCPWRMPRPNIPAAMRTFRMRLRSSVTSQLRPLRTSRSLSSLFGKRHSTPVLPFGGGKDQGVTCLQELRGSKSVGAVTDHFAKLEVGGERGKTRSPSSKRSLRNQVSDQGSIKCVFSLPGAVLDDNAESNPCALGDTTQRSSFYSEIDTNKVNHESSTSREVKSSLVHDEKTFTGQAGTAHEVDILVIKHSDEELKPFIPQKDVHEEPQELTLVEKFTASSSEDDSEDTSVDPTDDANICEPECSLDNELKDTTGKADMDNDASSGEDVLKIHYSETMRGKIPYADEDNLEEEVKFFEKTSEEGDDYVNLDNLLARCPKSEVIRNLQSAVELSKCATRQLEKALKKWSRISRGPFPRQPGTYKTKAEIVDDKTVALRSETARYLEEMNRVFFNFYCVTEQLDDIEERQGRLVDCIKEEMRSPTPPSSPRPVELPKRKQDLADLYIDNRLDGHFEMHKVKAMLGNRIPPTITEEEEEEEKDEGVE